MSEQQDQDAATNTASLQDLFEVLSRVENQNTFMRQQLAMLNTQMQEQAGKIQTAANQLEHEYQRFQSGAGKRAIAVIFHKFVADLVEHMNQIDDLLAVADSETRSNTETAWIESIQALQGNLHSILEKWGCDEIQIETGQTIFDPEIHEAVDDDQDIPEDTEEDTIIRIVRRGWKLGETIIQYPQVVVA